MKMKAWAALFSILFLFTANSAWAQVQMSTVSVPAAMTNPLDGFTINYTMTGSKYGVGAASAQVKFYLSSTRDGSSGVYPLYSSQILLRGSGLGPYYPPSGTQSVFIARYTIPSNNNTVAQLEYITAACQPQTWYILGQVDSTNIAYTTSVLGSTKQPDFYFTGGTLSPNVIQPGGTTNVSFDLYSKCPANNASRVGIYLTDANFQLLSTIGYVNIAAGTGGSLPPTGITFSSAIAPGTYQIYLIADADGVVAESNESNNNGYFTLTVSSSARATISRDASRMQLGFEVPDETASVVSGLKLGTDAYLNGF